MYKEKYYIKTQTLIFLIFLLAVPSLYAIELPKQVDINVVKLFNGQCYNEKEPIYFQAEIESNLTQIPSDYVLWLGIKKGTNLNHKEFKSVIFGNGEDAVSLSVTKDANLLFHIPVVLHFNLQEPYIELNTSFAIDDNSFWDKVEYIKLHLRYDTEKWKRPHFKWSIKDLRSDKWTDKISNGKFIAAEFIDPERSETELRFDDTDHAYLELLPYGAYKIRCKITNGDTGESKLVYTTVNFVKQKEHFIHLENLGEGEQMTFEIGPKISCATTYEQIRHQSWSFNVTKTETWSEEIGVAIEAGIDYVQASLSRQMQYEVSISKNRGISINVGHDFKWDPSDHEPFKEWLQRPAGRDALERYLPNYDAMGFEEFQQQVTKAAEDHYCEYLMQPTVTVPTTKYLYRPLYIYEKNDIKKLNKFLLYVPRPPATDWVYDYKYYPKN